MLHTYFSGATSISLKRRHINRHHHAVSLCGEEISKGKLDSAIVTIDACNSEMLSDLNIEPPDDIERKEKKKENYAGRESHFPH